MITQFYLMKHQNWFYISIFLLLWNLNTSMAQDTLSRKYKYSFAIDAGFSITSSHDSYRLNEYSFSSKTNGGQGFRLDFIYYPKKNFGYSLSWESYLYSYDVPLDSQSIYTNFKVINSEPIDFNCFNVLFGINYKLRIFKILYIIPRLQFGLNFVQEGSSNILLKENESNNIREANTVYKSSNPNYFFSARTDFRLKILKQYGCLLSFYTENYSRDINFYEYTKDNAGQNQMFEKIKYEHLSFNMSLGIFYCF
jgi:hypothetical protein